VDCANEHRDLTARAKGNQMAGRPLCFTLLVFALDHESKASELAHINRACQSAAQDVRAAGGTKTEGIVLGDGATEIGHWQYLPNDLAR
jgi:hypothetical protein